MNKYENKVYQKYKKFITRSVIRTYRNMAKREAQSKKIYLDDVNVNKQIKEIERQIFETYSALIEDEIKYRLEKVMASEKYKLAIIREKELSKKNLSYKSLKMYRECPINISPRFLEILSEEMGEHNISPQNIKYLTLVILYGILKKIKEGVRIKFCNLFYIWAEKRDFICNLPDTEQRIMPDRIIPKFKFSKAFDRKMFHKLNEDNEAILEFYRQKTERFLMYLGLKNRNEKKD